MGSEGEIKSFCLGMGFPIGMDVCGELHADVFRELHADVKS